MYLNTSDKNDLDYPDVWFTKSKLSYALFASAFWCTKKVLMCERFSMLFMLGIVLNDCYCQGNCPRHYNSLKFSLSLTVTVWIFTVRYFCIVHMNPKIYWENTVLYNSNLRCNSLLIETSNWFGILYWNLHVINEDFEGILDFRVPQIIFW